MIQNISLQVLRNGEYLQYLTDVLSVVLNNNPDNMQVPTQYNALLSVTNDTEKLFKISLANPVTEEIIALDERRDNVINGLVFLTTGFKYSTDAATKQAATVLTEHLALFGSGIAKDNYQSETASIRNIINDWNNKPELELAITTLQLNNWTTELETANNAFNYAYMKRTETIGAASPDKLDEKRSAANIAYYKLRDTINAHLTLTDGAEPYATATQTINAIIAQYNTLLKIRAAKATVTPVNSAPIVVSNE